MDKDQTLKRLLDGNQAYLSSRTEIGDISQAVRLETAERSSSPAQIRG